MKLKDVIKSLEILESKGDLEVEITNLGSDSRKLSAGGLFFAIKGFDMDGAKFIESATKEKGAVAVVVESDFDMKNCLPNITYIRVQNVRKVLAEMSNNFYDHPADKLKAS